MPLLLKNNGDNMKYIIGIDQSTQGTKAVLFDEMGSIIGRADYKHRQMIDKNGYISHDTEEIYQNVLKAVKTVINSSKILEKNIEAVAISNQRETTAAWSKQGNAIGGAVVWQCFRAIKITEQLNKYASLIYEKTGLPLSPYFPAAKMKWLIDNVITEKEYCLGTIDSFLVYRLTKGKCFKTDYSNASRTQIFNIHTLLWDDELLNIFKIPKEALPEVCDSNACFGYTDFEGLLSREIPIHSVMGDSHGALFGHGCHSSGMIKATYGTGSSIMMNLGTEYHKSSKGLATSIAWSMDGKVNYCLEGNINYTGAVVSWLQNDMKLISSLDELEDAIALAKKEDETILVPAFSGLSAPYWREDAKAMIYGMSRTTRREEILKAALESIAFQVTDVLNAMKTDSNIIIKELRADGGVSKNKFLMQFQSDISDIVVSVPKKEELSVIGVAYMAGITMGIYDKSEVFSNLIYETYKPIIREEEREHKCKKWKQAVNMVLTV